MTVLKLVGHYLTHCIPLRETCRGTILDTWGHLSLHSWMGIIQLIVFSSRERAVAAAVEGGV